MDNLFQAPFYIPPLGDHGQYTSLYGHSSRSSMSRNAPMTAPLRMNVDPPAPQLPHPLHQPVVTWTQPHELRSVPPPPLPLSTSNGFGGPAAGSRFVPSLAFPHVDQAYASWPSSALPSPGSQPASPYRTPTPTGQPRTRSLSFPPVGLEPLEPHDAGDDELVPPPPTMNGRTSHSHRVPRNYVKRPPNGFLRFRSHFIARNASLPKGDPARLEESRVISRAAGMVWRGLSAEEKERWKREAKMALEDFKLQHPDDDAARKERARVRRRSKQRRAHAAVDDDAARRAAAVALGETWVA